MHWTRWNWYDDGLLPLILVGLRACWLWPWLALLRTWFYPRHAGEILPLAVLVALPLLSLTLARLGGGWTAGHHKPRAGRDEPALWARGLAAMVGLLAMLILAWSQVYRTDFGLLNAGWLRQLGEDLIRWEAGIGVVSLVLMAAAYLWWRGTADAARPMSHEDMWSTFMAGVALWTLYLVAHTLTFGHVTGDALQGAVVFLAIGMAGLAFTSLKITTGLDMALGLDRQRAARAPAVNRYWLTSTGVVILAVLGLGFLLALVITPDLVARLLAVAAWIVDILWRILTAIILLFASILFLLAYYAAQLLRPLINRLLALLNFEQAQQMLDNLATTPTPEAALADPAVIPDPFRWAGLLAFVILLLLAFALAMHRLRRPAPQAVDETRESILSMDLLGDQLASLLGRWRDRLRGQGSLSPFLSLDGEAGTRRVIRRIYQELLARSSALGAPRERSQTPAAFGRHLASGLLREQSAAVQAITTAYEVARYAAESPADRIAQAAQGEWTQIEAALRPPEPSPETARR